MALQKAIRKSYIEYLKTHINVDAYLQDEFAYDSTQMALCGMTGLDLKYLSDIENGHKNVSIGVVERLSKAFGVKISELFRLADTM